jgi:hypothetical protein
LPFICAARRKGEGEEWGGTNLDTGGFVQLVRFHVYNIARLAINTPRNLSIRMFCLERKEENFEKKM